MSAMNWRRNRICICIVTITIWIIIWQSKRLVFIFVNVRYGPRSAVSCWISDRLTREEMNEKVLSSKLFLTSMIDENHLKEKAKSTSFIEINFRNLSNLPKDSVPLTVVRFEISIWVMILECLGILADVVDRLTYIDWPNPRVLQDNRLVSQVWVHSFFLDTRHLIFLDDQMGRHLSTKPPKSKHQTNKHLTFQNKQLMSHRPIFLFQKYFKTKKRNPMKFLSFHFNIHMFVVVHWISVINLCLCSDSILVRFIDRLSDQLDLVSRKERYEICHSFSLSQLRRKLSFDDHFLVRFGYFQSFSTE